MHIREIHKLETLAHHSGTITGEAEFSDGYRAKFHLSKNSDGPVSGWPVRLWKRDTRDSWNNRDGWTPNPRPSPDRANAIRAHFADTAENLIEIAFRESAEEEAETQRRADLRLDYQRKRSAGPALYEAVESLLASLEDRDQSVATYEAIAEAKAALELAVDGASRRFKARPIGAEYWSSWPFEAVDADDARERYAFTAGLDLKDAQGRIRSYLPEEIEVEEVLS